MRLEEGLVDDGRAATQPPATGLPRVDDVIARLADLDERPVNEHPEALAALHEALHTELESSSEPTEAPDA